MKSANAIEKFKKVRCCPLCGSAGRLKLYALDQTDVYNCTACRLSYLDPCLDTDAMAAVYESSETLKELNPFHEGYYEYGDLKKASQTLREFTKTLETLERRVPHAPERKLFEIGYGNGMFLALAEKRGWQIDGIDTSLTNAGLASRKFGLKLKTGYFKQDTLPSWKPNVIAMLDLIEHLSDPHSLLKDISRTLPEKGFLVIATPNENSFLRLVSDLVYKLSGKRVKTGIEKIYFLEHVTYFRLETLKRLVEENGFKAVDYFYSNTDIEKYRFNLLEKCLGNTIIFFQKLTGLQNRLLLIAQKI